MPATLSPHYIIFLDIFIYIFIASLFAGSEVKYAHIK